MDFKNSIHTIRTDKLVQTDPQIEHVRRMVQISTNPDEMIRASLDHQIAFNGALLACIETNDKALNDVVHLLVNQVFSA